LDAIPGDSWAFGIGLSAFGLLGVGSEIVWNSDGLIGVVYGMDVGSPTPIPVDLELAKCHGTAFEYYRQDCDHEADYNNCCSEDHKCTQGQGGCYNNNQCSGDLVCGSYNCNYFGDEADWEVNNNCCQAACLEFGTGYIGHDLPHQPAITTSSWKDCALLCQENDQCNYWTMSDGHLCYLKSSKANRMKKYRHVSGCKGDTYFYGIGRWNAVWRTTENGNWQKVSSGSVTKIVVHGNTIYGLGTSGNIFKTTPNGSWSRITSGKVITDFDYSNGYFYGIGRDDRAVYRTKENLGSWSRYTSGSVTKIVVDGDTVYGIGTDHAIWKHTNNGHWSRVTSPHVIDLAYSNGYLYGVGSSKAVFRTEENGSWTKITSTGAVTKIVVQGNTIYGLGETSRAIWKHPVNGGGGWSRVSWGIVTDISLGVSGGVF